MTNELVAISELLKPNSTPLEVSHFILNNDNFIPHVAVALRIILTIPVSVA
ncbi:Dimer Tnp hAT domain-containing protein, partial [Aphis craccivora]